MPLEVALCTSSRNVQQQFNLIEWQIQSDMLTNIKKGTKAAASHWSRAHPWVPWGLLSHIPVPQGRGLAAVLEGLQVVLQSCYLQPCSRGLFLPCTAAWCSLQSCQTRAANEASLLPAGESFFFFSILTSKSQCLHEELLTEMMQWNCTSLQHLWG